MIIDKNKIDAAIKAGFDRSDIDDAVDIINGIYTAISNPGFGYLRGHRNNIAVDLTCACYVIDVDPDIIIGDLASKYRITSVQHLNAYDRIKVVKDYTPAWGTDVLEYTLEADEWKEWADNTEDKFIIIKA